MSLNQHHFLVAEPHLSPRVSAHIHPAQKDPVLAVQVYNTVVVQSMQRILRLMWCGSTKLGLNGIVVLLIDDVVHRVPVYQQVLHAVAQVLGGVVRDVQQFAVLRHHHQEAAESLGKKWNTRIKNLSAFNRFSTGGRIAD